MGYLPGSSYLTAVGLTEHLRVEERRRWQWLSGGYCHSIKSWNEMWRLGNLVTHLAWPFWLACPDCWTGRLLVQAWLCCWLHDRQPARETIQIIKLCLSWAISWHIQTTSLGLWNAFTTSISYGIVSWACLGVNRRYKLYQWMHFYKQAIIFRKTKQTNKTFKDSFFFFFFF